jgi:nucleoside-diphosphate-sugar epimerase
MIVSPKRPQGRGGGQNSAYRPAATLYGSSGKLFAEVGAMSFYLVTGGAGFIGSHLTEELVRRGERVRVVDSLITGKRQNLAHIPRVEFLEGDLADPEVAKQAVAGVDYVLHQAAIPSVPRSVVDPVTSHRANVDASLNLLVAARDAHVKRVVYAGSSSAYGNTPTLPKTESMPTGPLSPYALQKLVAEQYCQLFTNLYGLETVTTRYFNVFGPRQDPSSPYSGVISLFISALCDGRRPTIYGDGGQTRDFTYVANVVDGVLRACHAPEASGEVINVATGGRVSLNELFRTVRDLVGGQQEPIYAETRAGDVRDSQADIEKARRLLGYQPIVSFADGLKKTVEWYRASHAAVA